LVNELAGMLYREVTVIRDWEMSRRNPPLPDFIEWADKLGLRLRVSDNDRWLPWDVYAIVLPRHDVGVATYELRRYATVFKMRREELALAPEKLAEQVGVSPVTIERWESGIATPALVRMIAHAQALDLVVELIEKTDVPP
jgi:ribosome-binding protein aMBF1 (putative translation factor)